MIAVRTVVRVLLDSHDLERIVPCRDDVGQSLRAKLLVARHAHLLATHPYVTLIDEQSIGTLRCWRLDKVRFFGSPDTSAEGVVSRVLHDIMSVGGDAL